MAKQKDKVLPTIGLVVNILIPGVGTLLSGNKKDVNIGIAQLVLALLSLPLMLIVIGFFTGFAAWVWAIATSIRQIAE